MEAFRRQPDEVEGSPVNPTEVTGEPPIDRECVKEKRDTDCVYPGCLCKRTVE